MMEMNKRISINNAPSSISSESNTLYWQTQFFAIVLIPKQSKGSVEYFVHTTYNTSQKSYRTVGKETQIG